MDLKCKECGNLKYEIIVKSKKKLSIHGIILFSLVWLFFVSVIFGLSFVDFIPKYSIGLIGLVFGQWLDIITTGIKNSK